MWKEGIEIENWRDREKSPAKCPLRLEAISSGFGTEGGASEDDVEGVWIGCSGDPIAAANETKADVQDEKCQGYGPNIGRYAGRASDDNG